MTGLEIVLLLLVFIMAGLTAAALLGGRNRSQQSADAMAAFRQELQTLVSTQVQSLTAQLGQVSQSVTQQLGQVRQELESGVAHTGQLASDAQREVARQLQASNETVRQISQKLGEVQKFGQDLSQTAQTLQQVLGGAKSRGTLGEVTLERLLEDALPRAAYEIQYRFSTGDIVDAAVRNGERILSIDSKFPLDAYRRLIDSGADDRREFSQAVRKHADSIAEKYILPGEGTLDYALMFVPSEGVYYELLMTEDAKYGMLDEYCRDKRVFPVSPNTLYACLGAIALSLQGQKIAENAQHLLASLAGLRKQLESFADVYEKLGNHLRFAQQSYEEADSKLSRARITLEQMAQGALPEAAPKALEAAAKE